MKIKTILNIGVVSTFLVVVGSIALMATRGSATQTAATQLPVLGEVPPFTLLAAGGLSLRRDDLRNQVWIASFIFTRCAEVCPAMMRQQSRLQARLAARGDLKFVSFSVDPDWDTPGVLAEYAGNFAADTDRWLFLTGDKSQIYHLAQDGFHLSTAEAQLAEEMPILHSTKLVLVDRHGLIRGYYDSNDEAEMHKLVRDVRRVIAQRS